MIRPMTSSSRASACSWVSFSFSTSLSSCALGHLARLLEPGVDELLLDVLEDDRDVGGGDRLGDLAAHRAGADDGGLEDEHAWRTWLIGR